MRAILILPVCLLLLLARPCSPATSTPYTVVDVINGDTLLLAPVHGGDSTTVKLFGLAAPGLGQPYGYAAKAFVVSAALHKTVKVRPVTHSKDSSAALVEVPGMGSLQEMLLEAGLAWVWPRQCKKCSNWEAIQADAKVHERGLWADKARVAPWRWQEK